MGPDNIQVINMRLSFSRPTMNSGMICMYVNMYRHHIVYSKSMNQPGKVANPARGQLNREDEYFPVPVRA